MIGCICSYCYYGEKQMFKTICYKFEYKGDQKNHKDLVSTVTIGFDKIYEEKEDSIKNPEYLEKLKRLKTFRDNRKSFKAERDKKYKNIVHVTIKLEDNTITQGDYAEFTDAYLKAING